MFNVPRVGVGVLILREGKVLMGRRKSEHGAGTWAPPGGHLELNETIEECAIRETREETGLTLRNIRTGPFTNDIFSDSGKHYITLFVTAEPDAGEATVMEPEKCEKWEWVSWDNLPQPLFLTIRNLLKQQYSPFEGLQK